MAIDDNIVTNYVKQFKANALMLAQQKDHRLAGTYLTEDLKGEEGYVEQYGTTSFGTKTQRLEVREANAVTSDRRKYTTSGYEWYHVFDKQDEWKSLIDIQGSWMNSAKAAQNRLYDQLCINGMLGTAYTGKDGTTAVALPSTQKLDNPGGTATTGLTYAKLQAAIEIFDKNDVLDEEFYLVLSPTAKKQLMADDKFVNGDYNAAKPIAGYTIPDGYMGISKYIVSNLLPLNSSTRSCVMWTKSALQMAISKNVEADIFPDKRYKFSPMAATIFFDIGVTRLEEKKVVSIGVLES